MFIASKSPGQRRARAESIYSTRSTGYINVFSLEASVIVGERLKAIRESKDMSQGDIERKTGLLRCYISRVENGHTVPAIETLEKMARAMDIELYQLFFEKDGKPEELKLPKRQTQKLSGKDGKVLSRLSTLLPRMDDRDKTLLVGFAQKMAGK
jgi:transcriptional regulator with XRE-family HTH domain